jgi:Taurine catabolism dioxygenase TauD, TfdA family
MTTIRLQPIDDPSVWRGAALGQESTWMYRLTAEHLRDLDAAVGAVERRGLELADIDCHTFPLPSMQLLLECVARDVLRGRGFAVLRGLPVERASVREAELMLWGVSAHLGVGVSQNARGELIGHVRDEGLDPDTPNVRGYKTRAPLPFHCDSSDVVALLCRRAALSGGQSALVSAGAIYNEIVAHHPEYLGILYSGFVYDRRGEEAPGELPFTRKVPVFSYHEGDVSCRYLRGFIESAQAKTGIPLSRVETEVLDHIDALANREEMQLRMELLPGDIQLVNNYTVLHSRTAYEDHPEPERKRHLLRLWIHVPGIRRLSDDFVLRWGRHNSREGIAAVHRSA